MASRSSQASTVAKDASGAWAIAIPMISSAYQSSDRRWTETSPSEGTTKGEPSLERREANILWATLAWATSSVNQPR